MNDFFVIIFSKIRINPYFWIVIFLGVITGYFRQLILLFIIIFIHEMGHACAAYYYKWRIKKIELLPFGGVAEVEEYGNRPFKEEFIVTIAGPVQHFWMVLFAIILNGIGFIDNRTFDQFVNFNLMILLFNLFPIWPLDGGKLLFLLLAKKFPYKLAHQYMLFLSFSFLMVFIFISLVIFPFQLNIWIVGLFLGFTHYIEWKQKHYLFMRFLMERLYPSKMQQLKVKTIIADQNMQIKDVLAQFYKGYQHEIMIKRNMTYRKVNELFILEQMVNHNLFSTKLKDVV